MVESFATMGAAVCATVTLAGSGVSVMLSLMPWVAGAAASMVSGPSWVRSHRMDIAATPAAMPAPKAGRAKRIQREDWADCEAADVDCAGPRAELAFAPSAPLPSP